MTKVVTNAHFYFPSSSKPAVEHCQCCRSAGRTWRCAPAVQSVLVGTSGPVWGQRGAAGGQGQEAGGCGDRWASLSPAP